MASSLQTARRSAPDLGGDRDRGGLRPRLHTHVAHAVEMRPFLNRNQRRSNIPDQDARLQNMNFFHGCNRAVDLSTVHQDARRHNALDHGMLAHDQRAGGMNFSFHSAIDPDRSVKIDHTLKVDIFRQ